MFATQITMHLGKVGLPELMGVGSAKAAGRLHQYECRAGD